MNKQQLGTKLALDALEIPLSLTTFDERLLVQKSIYLAKAAGHDCGYFFRWYLRGPYSPELTRDVFSINAEQRAGLDESEGWRLDDASAHRLEQAKRLIPDVDLSTKARQLELLASVHFLIDRGQVPNADVTALVALLAKYDKNFSEPEVTEALRELRNNELLPK